jgi:hypothetical protein
MNGEANAEQGIDPDATLLKLIVPSYRSIDPSNISK